MFPDDTAKDALNMMESNDVQGKMNTPIKMDA
jgi:hypothetical protein